MRKTEQPQYKSPPIPARAFERTEMEVVCDLLKERYQWFFDGKPKGTLWVYDTSSGLWKADGITKLRNVFNKVYSNKSCDEKGSKGSFKKQLAEIESFFLSSLSHEEKELPEPPTNLIPMSNGVFDLDKNTLIEYKPEHYFTGKLPWKYNPKATCEWFDSLFEQWVDNPSELIDIIALILYREMPVQKMFLFLGSGANGKSMFLQILQRAIGDNNYSTIPLQDLGSRFCEIELYRKLANIVDELEENTIKSTGVIKRFTGDSRISADVKNKSRVSFTSYATQIFAMNVLPPTDDKTAAFFRRIHLINFPRTIPMEKRDKTLPSKIANNINDFEGLLLRSIRALQAARRRGWIFDGLSFKDDEENRKEYSNKSDTVDFLISEFGQTHEGAKIAHVDVVNYVNRMRKAMNIGPVPPSFVKRRVESLGYEKERFRMATGDTQVCWVNLYLNVEKIHAWLECHEIKQEILITQETRDWFDACNSAEMAVLRAVYSGYSTIPKICEVSGLDEVSLRIATRDLRIAGFVSGDKTSILPPIDRAKRSQIEALLKES